ncbi:hypothetical protein IFR04_001218 [Cadophora malorum]|uniref:Uncharacterized protein n=1 Tax=Cadophora malorum TaxID=108018 RepID=A0A8H7WIY0_9HELO|nr:hypothetical protein IFR04_001218 [Cadophora malorum]
MQLIEHPSEILHLMLLYAALNCGIKRTLRLRVVCKTFERGLCSALIETHIPDNRCGPCENAIGSKDWPKGPAPPPGLTKTALFSAAAHFGLLSLAKRLLDQGLSPVAHNYIYAPPVQVAAQAGNLVMVQLFRSKLSKTVFEPFSVIGAAVRDDLEVVKVATQQADDVGPLRFGSVSHSSETGQATIKARSYTTVPEIFDYLTS